MTIPYGRQSVDADDIEAVVAVLRGDWLTQGPDVAEFERAFAAACDAPFAVAFSSGTAALHAAAFAGGIGEDDDLLTSALTFSASANCGAYMGATPRFADIDQGTWNVSAETIAAALTPDTRVVVPVHFAGLPAPVAEIRRAVGEEVVIVEDAAHALGARSQDGVVGSCTYSDMAVFSTHPVKAITTGEGGVVTTCDERLRERLAMFRNHGFVAPDRQRRNDGGWYREQQALGFNYRLSDLHCALGSSQLRKLGRFIAARNEVADRYRQSLADIPGLRMPPEAPEGSLHAYHLFVVHCDDHSVRQPLYDGLRERDILTQVHYLPVYLHPYYMDTYGYRPGLCPAAEEYYAGCLSLPCFPSLSQDDQRRVTDAIRELWPA
jgi:UDP-4-amino-4,6-dideoxy-N-acetyl-beta-L-altrosamine transaminase